MESLYIQISKLRATDNPEFPTSNVKDFIHGAINPGVSLPAEYTATGILQREVEVGKGLFMIRDSRNGAPSLGILQTSPVTDIFPITDGLIIHTANSVYELKWLPI